jgi:hypothetical protein
MSFASAEHNPARSPSENCAQIKKLGYTAGRHMNLYGEHIELISDPFVEGEYVAAHVTSSTDPSVHTIELPISILSGWDELFPEPTTAAKITSNNLLSDHSATSQNKPT